MLLGGTLHSQCRDMLYSMLKTRYLLKGDLWSYRFALSSKESTDKEIVRDHSAV